MKNKFLIATMLFLVGMSCTEKKATVALNEPPVAAETTTSNLVALTAIQIKTAGIEVGNIEMKNLQTSIRSNGMLSVPNQNKAYITSVSSGVIRTLLIQPGNFVKKGQIIATIVNPGLADLQQELQTIKASYDLAEIEYNRQKELVEGNAAPLKNLQRSETEKSTLKTRLNAIEKQLTAMGVSVRRTYNGAIATTVNVTAPISGTISNVNAQIGSQVDESTSIGEIVNNSQLHLDLFIYEKDLASVKADQTIHFTLTNNSGKEYDAQIYSIGTAFANESKTIPVHAIVKGDKTGLIEGMNITALISIGTALMRAVPTDAIVNFQGQDYIFVNLPGEQTKNSTNEMIFHRIAIVKGVSDIGYTEITLLKELPANTKIITKGAFFALAKMTNLADEE